MIHILSITNKFIYVDFKPVNFLQPISLQNTIFCGVFGDLIIYGHKIQFTIYNADYIDVYESMIIVLKENLRKNYRTKDDLSYFNKKFNFDLVVTNKYCSLIISKR